jgi:hypothetical protein
VKPNAMGRPVLGQVVNVAKRPINPDEVEMWHGEANVIMNDNSPCAECQRPEETNAATGGVSAPGCDRLRISSGRRWARERIAGFGEAEAFWAAVLLSIRVLTLGNDS